MQFLSHGYIDKSTGLEMAGAFVYHTTIRGEKRMRYSAKETPCRTVQLRGKTSVCERQSHTLVNRTRLSVR